MPSPQAGQRGTDRLAGAIAIQPGVHPHSRGEHDATINDSQCAIYAQPQALERHTKVRGIDELAVGRGLARDSLEAQAIQEGSLQRMARERRVQPGDAGRSFCKGCIGRA